MLRWRFGFPAQITATSWNTRHVTASELLRMYSITIPQNQLNITLQYHAMDDLLDDILLFSLPWTMALQVQNQSVQTNAILNDITYSKVHQCNSVQCYFLTKNPQASSTGMSLIRTTPIPLLSSPTFSQLKRNGLHMTWPQFILATKQHIRSAEYKPSRKNWFSSNLFWSTLNN